MRVAIIGGGAAGFFAAISAKEHHPEAAVTILEKSAKVLSKVKISGGGRCNVTHDCRSSADLSKHYPRGERFMKRAFQQFNVNHTIKWFNDQGVELKTESDGRMFPTTDRSQTIIDALTYRANELGVNLKLQQRVSRLQQLEGGFRLWVNDDQETFDRVIVATGGSPTKAGLVWLSDLGLETIDPVPSLFTFNLPGASITALQGVSVQDAVIWLEGEKWRTQGPVLVTHWGLSGPAVLKSSAIAAVPLEASDYQARVHVNWLGGLNEDALRTTLNGLQREKKKILNRLPDGIPSRLWNYLLDRIGIDGDRPWHSCSKKELNRILDVLSNDVYEMKGKTTFKEEFVTAGGVALSEVDHATMQSKKLRGLYFAGEVLNIDGFTGGFNFQAAWTTAWIAGKLD